MRAWLRVVIPFSFHITDPLPAVCLSLSPCSVYLEPQMAKDLISSHSLLSHSLVAVSTGDAFTYIHKHLSLNSNLPSNSLSYFLTQNWVFSENICLFYITLNVNTLRLNSYSLLSPPGYFIRDFLDVALNQSFKLSWEVLLHHSVVKKTTLHPFFFTDQTKQLVITWQSS